MEFTSKKLQQSFEIAKPILEKITDTKDSLSMDIKNLEKVLQSFHINETISYLATNPRIVANINFDTFSHDTGYGVGTATEELVVWDHTKKRILYVHNIYLASVDMDDEYQDVTLNSVETIVKKPLIETTFEIRKRVCENYLSEFLLYITDKFRVVEKESNQKPRASKKKRKALSIDV